MKKLSYALIALLGLVSISAQANDTEAANVKTARQAASDYAIHAQKQDPNVVLSAEAGQAFYTKKIIITQEGKLKGKEVSCAACHTDNPAANGKHMVSGKKLPPMAPSVNSKRFKDIGKSNKGFSDHCRDLYGKDCSAADKSNFITYVLTK